MPEADAGKFAAMIEVQWYLTAIGAMCGAADHLDLLPSFDDFNPMGQIVPLKSRAQDKPAKTQARRKATVPPVAAAPPMATRLPYPSEQLPVPIPLAIRLRYGHVDALGHSSQHEPDTA
ncbi:hypothetical protein ACHAPZ_005687 [Fusarium culmorum]